MICGEALQLILEADPSELEGQADSPLAGHIRECPHCRKAAQAILEDQEALAEALASEVSAPVLEDLLTEVLGPATSEEAEDSPRRLRLHRKAFGFSILPVAAAAALAALFLSGEPRLPGDPYVVPESAPGFAVEAPEGSNVAVLATNNPDITVLWFY